MARMVIENWYTHNNRNMEDMYYDEVCVVHRIQPRIPKFIYVHKYTIFCELTNVRLNNNK